MILSSTMIMEPLWALAGACAALQVPADRMQCVKKSIA